MVTKSSGPKENPSSEPTQILVSMLSRMLRPLIRLLIDQQVQYPVLARVVKRLYLEVAEEDFALPGKRLTVSRLSLLTGIQRRQVGSLLEERNAEEAPLPRTMALGSQIIASWTGESPWIDRDGKPLPLLRRSSGDPEALSFQRLVESINADIHSRSVLDEWERLGIVSLSADGHVVLESGAFVPTHGFEEKAHIIGRNVRDHLAVARHNLTEDGPPFVERSVYYGSLPPAAIKELSALAEELGQAALQQVHQRALQLKRNAARRKSDSDLDPERFNFGIYIYSADADDVAKNDPIEERGADEHED